MLRYATMNDIEQQELLSAISILAKLADVASKTEGASIAGELTQSVTVPTVKGVQNFNLRTVTSFPDSQSGDVRSFYLDAHVRPTGTFLSFATGEFVSQAHDGGQFDLPLAGIRALVANVLQAVAGTYVNEARGAEAIYRCTAGKITQAIGLLVARGFAGDGGNIENGIGIKILASKDPQPQYLDIAIWSLGGENRFVGPVMIGEDRSPDGLLEVGTLKIDSAGHLYLNGKPVTTGERDSESPGYRTLRVPN